MALFVKLLFLQIFIHTCTSTWTHENQHTWPKTCKGKLQSPIQLPSKYPVKSQFNQLTFDYKSYIQSPITLKNTGHTVEISFSNPSHRPTISGGGLDGEYIFKGFHFHWPSEHKITGQKFPLEGHFVFYAKKYRTFENALEVKNGVSVLAVFYALQTQNNPSFGFVAEVANIAQNVGKEVISKFAVALTDLIPVNSKFYRYDGSLTVPNCNEIIVWTVFMTPLHISKQQLNDLTTIRDGNNKPLKNNNRKLQKLNGRPVYVKI